MECIDSIYKLEDNLLLYPYQQGDSVRLLIFTFITLLHIQGIHRPEAFRI